MNEFKEAFEALAKVEATLRCGCSVTEEERLWSSSLYTICRDYREAFENYDLNFKL